MTADCLNCGAPRTGAYCAACGQPAVDLAAPTWHVVRDALADATDVDGRVPRTARALGVPGRLTIEYLRGRRAPYLGPVRLYLLAGAALTTAWAVTRGVDARYYGMRPYDARSLAYIDAVVRGLLAAGGAVALLSWAMSALRRRLLDEIVFAVHLVAALALWAAVVILATAAWKLAWGTAAAVPTGVPPLYALLFAPACAVALGYVAMSDHRVHGGAWWIAVLRALLLAAVGVEAVLLAVRVGAG